MNSIDPQKTYVKATGRHSEDILIAAVLILGIV